MAKAWGGTFSESNALSFSEHVPGDAVPTAHHVDKLRLKRKGLEVVFDPAAHKCAAGLRRRASRSACILPV